VIGEGVTPVKIGVFTSIVELQTGHQPLHSQRQAQTIRLD